MMLMKRVVVVVVVLVVVDAVRREHRARSVRRRGDKEKASVPREFKAWHAYNERFIALVSRSPSRLNHTEVKPSLNTLLVDLNYLPHVNQYVSANINVTTARQARRVYTLLDLYSAQDPLRHNYLQQMRATLVILFERFPELTKQTVPITFVLNGFDRHVRNLKQKTRDLYRRVLLPHPDNLNLVAYYCPGRLPSLDLALHRHGLPSPFVTMDENEWYQITMADPPHLALNVDLLTWRLLLDQHSFNQTLFRFEDAVPQFLQSKRYVLRNAALPAGARLTSTCTQDDLCFDNQKKWRGSLEVIGLPEGEVVVVHKQRGRAYFLRHASQQVTQGNTTYPKVFQPTLHLGYPGRSAHWILTPRRSVVPT